MINIIINNQIFIPKENILYIDTECVVRYTVAGASVKQCTIFLKGVNGGGCDGVSSIAPLQIPIPYEHIAILKQAVRDALTGISTNNCLKLNTEQEPIYTDALSVQQIAKDKVKDIDKDYELATLKEETEWRKYLQEQAQAYLDRFTGFDCPSSMCAVMVDFVLGLDKRFLALLSFPDSLPSRKDGIKEELHKERELLDFVYVDCPKCDCSNEVFTKDKDFPLIQCASCAKEFTYYQAIKPKPIESLATVAHCSNYGTSETLCGKSLEGLDVMLETWHNKFHFLGSIKLNNIRCSQCYLIATQTA